MDGACGTQGGEAKYTHTGFCGGKLKRRDNLEDLDVDGRTNNETGLKK